MSTIITRSGDFSKSAAVIRLAEHIAFERLGPSATREELTKEAKSIPEKNLGALYDLFIRESKKQGTVLLVETRPRDFKAWYVAEKTKLAA